MSMSKKDYIAIAAAIKDARKREGSAILDRVAAEILAPVLAADNPKFDRARFLTACGVQS